MLVCERDFVLVNGAGEVLMRSEHRELCGQKVLEMIDEQRDEPFLSPLRIVKVAPGEIVRAKEMTDMKFETSKLRELRNRKGIAITVVAKQLKMSPMTLSAYERGTKKVTEKHRMLLAKYYKTSEATLFGGE